MKEMTFEQKCDQVSLLLRQQMERSVDGNSDKIPTEEELMKAIESASTFQEVIGEKPFDSVEKEKIRKELESIMVIKMKVGKKIIDQNTYVDWLKVRKSEIEEYYWNRYKRYLLDMKNWSPSVVDTLDRVGDEILNLLGDPLE